MFQISCNCRAYTARKDHRPKTNLAVPGSSIILFAGLRAETSRQTLDDSIAMPAIDGLYQC